LPGKKASLFTSAALNLLNRKFRSSRGLGPSGQGPKNWAFPYPEERASLKNHSSKAIIAFSLWLSNPIVEWIN
jgi:hypothetical protein